MKTGGLKLADPIDLAVSRAFHRGSVCRPQTPGALMLETAMAAEAGTVDPLTARTAEIIFSFDQEAIERPWSRLGPLARETYYDIARAVIAEVRRG